MYAIVKTGGKQYRVERGQRLLIERLAVEEGADVALEPILYRSEETVFDKAGLQRVTVNAKVLGHVRGEKLRVFKFKPKRGYKRRTGHRQSLTEIEVTEITTGRAKTATEPAKKPASEQPKKPASEQPKKPGPEQAKKPATELAKKPATGQAKKPATGQAKKPATGQAKKPATGQAKKPAAERAKPAAKAKKAATPRAKVKAATPKAEEKPKDGS
jgi:large subunit ribosomal protein L21